MSVDDVAQGQAVLAEAVSAYRQALGERLVARRCTSGCQCRVDLAEAFVEWRRRIVA